MPIIKVIIKPKAIIFLPVLELVQKYGFINYSYKYYNWNKNFNHINLTDQIAHKTGLPQSDEPISGNIPANKANITINNIAAITNEKLVMLERALYW